MTCVLVLECGEATRKRVPRRFDFVLLGIKRRRLTVSPSNAPGIPRATVDLGLGA